MEDKEIKKEKIKDFLDDKLKELEEKIKENEKEFKIINDLCKD